MPSERVSDIMQELYCAGMWEAHAVGDHCTGEENFLSLTGPSPLGLMKVGF